ncbi:MAG: transposase [Vicinamibacterales bacterium]
MPRSRRYTPPDSILHLVNRGNDRKRLFHADRDYEAFLELISETRTRCPMRLLAYCLMPNHWHMVVWPDAAQAVSAFCHRLCTVHALRHRRDTQTLGHGHLYQHRYHSFAVESERQYYLVMRYVEANPVRAGLVDQAQLWKWSSLAEREGCERGLLHPGPLPLPSGWAALVNEALPRETLDETRARLQRTKPYDLRVLRRKVAETASNSA